MDPPKQSYGFPFVPYEIQQQLMDHLYRTAASGGVSVAESPTGTVRPPSLSSSAPADLFAEQGKSLSIICSTFTYLRDAKVLKRQNLETSIRESVASSEAMKNEPGWVIEHEIKTKLDELDQQERELEERLEELREKERKERLRAARDTGRSLAKRQVRFFHLARSAFCG